ARAEDPALAVEDRHPRVRIALEAPERLGQLDRRARIDRVPHRGPVQHDGGHRPPLLGPDAHWPRTLTYFAPAAATSAVAAHGGPGPCGARDSSGAGPSGRALSTSGVW